jgi:hypothetical protein
MIPMAQEPERPLRGIKSEFKSLKEWGDWVNANCPPAREDDTPVLMGQTGPFPHRRATHDELMALVAEFPPPGDARQ